MNVFGSATSRLFGRFRRPHPSRSPSPTDARETKKSAVGSLLGSATSTAWLTLKEPQWTARTYEQLAREGFRKNAVCHRAVKIVAESAAAVPLTLSRGDQRIDRHPILDLLARPNPLQSGKELIEAFHAYLQIAGNAYLEAAETLDKRPGELYVLRPDRMKVIPGACGWPERFEYRVGAKVHHFQLDRKTGDGPVMHLRLFNPTDDWYGLSPLEAAAYAVESVTLDIGGSQSRYTLDGVITSDRIREDAIGDMLVGGMGQLIFQTGQFHLYAGADTPAGVTFTEDDLRAPISVQTKRPRREQVNRVTGRFLDAQNDLYEATNYPAVIDAAAEATDGNEVLELNLDLPMTQNGIRAQRLARIALKSARLQMSVTMPVNLKGLQVQAWSVIKVTNANFNWTDKLFRVMGWQISPDGGVDLTLSEYAASIYGWTPATDEQAVQVSTAPALADSSQQGDKLVGVADGADVTADTPEGQQAAQPSQNLLGPDAGPERSGTGPQNFTSYPMITLSELGIEAGAADAILSVSADMRTDTGTETLIIQLQFFNASNVWMADGTVTSRTNVTSATYQRADASGIQIPADVGGTPVAKIRIQPKNVGAGAETSFIRRAMLNRGPIALSFEEPPARIGRGEVEEGATLGATWSTDVFGRPVELTDGRITSGLDASGDLNRNLTTARTDSSNILRRTSGGLYSGDLNADLTSANTAAGIFEQGDLATQDTADFASDVTGAAKPADNATVGSPPGTIGAQVPNLLDDLANTEHLLGNLTFFFNGRGGAGTGVHFDPIADMGLVIGDTISAGALIKTDTGSGSASLLMRFYNSSNALLGTTFSGNSVSVGAGYERSIIEGAIIPANAVSIELRTNASGSATGRGVKEAILHRGNQTLDFVPSTSGAPAGTFIAGVESVNSIQETHTYVRFDGSINGSRVEVADDAAWDFEASEAGTVEAWIYFESLAGQPAVIGKNRGGGAAVGWGIDVASTGFRTITNDGSTIKLLTHQTLLSTRKWYHIAFTRSATGVFNSYLNGVKSDTTITENDTLANASTLQFGARQNTLDEMIGRMRDVRRWNTERTAQQITDNMFTTFDDSESGLIGFWPMNEGTGNTVFQKGSTSGGDGLFVTLGPQWSGAVGHGLGDQTSLNDANSLIDGAVIPSGISIDEGNSVARQPTYGVETGSGGDGDAITFNDVWVAHQTRGIS